MAAYIILHEKSSNFLYMFSSTIWHNILVHHLYLIEMKCENKQCFFKAWNENIWFQRNIFLLNLLKKKCEGLCYFVSSPAPQGQIGEKEIKREPILPEKGFLKARINSNIWAFGSIIQERYMQVTSSRKHFLHSYKFMCVLSLILAAPSSFCAYIFGRGANM